MVRSNFITADDMDKALAEKLTFNAPTNTFLAPHFVDYVLAELRQLGFQPGVQQLNVTTTLDWRMQQIGESIVSSNLSKNLWRDRNGVLSSGLVAVDPPTGNIKVMVGSQDYNSDGGQINYTTIPRNMGSSLKPYTYGAVVNARAATVDTPVYDGPTPLVYKDAYSESKIINYDGRSHGVIPLKKAMGNSYNIAAVKVELSIGVPAVLSYMRNIGVNPRIPMDNVVGYRVGNPNEYGPSLTLGGYPITLLEHASGMATYADMGLYHTPEAILKVTDSRGAPLYETKPDQRARAALDPSVAYIMAQIMADDNNRCDAFGCNSALHWRDRTVAAKTGTTDNFKDAVSVAFTPDLAVVIWIGDIKENKYTMVGGSDGSIVASPAVHQFIDQALAGVPGDRWYTPPPGVVSGPDNSWYLQDTRTIGKLPGDNPPTASPAPIDYHVPPDPGTGPVVAPAVCRSPSILGCH
jgi:membrane peptidoglycan carboxypeptidase